MGMSAPLGLPVARGLGDAPPARLLTINGSRLVDVATGNATVPVGARWCKGKLWGGGGGAWDQSRGGHGGLTMGRFPVNPGEVLAVVKGGGGGAVRGGGGYSGIFRGSIPILIAGAGGGAGGASYNIVLGGDGGGLVGGDGARYGGTGGIGGSQTAGGVNGGAYLAGGTYTGSEYNGRGGAGYYGGGGGIGSSVNENSGGGGGSSYAAPDVLDVMLIRGSGDQIDPDYTGNGYPGRGGTPGNPGNSGLVILEFWG